MGQTLTPESFAAAERKTDPEHFFLTNVDQEASVGASGGEGGEETGARKARRERNLRVKQLFKSVPVVRVVALGEAPLPKDVPRLSWVRRRDGGFSDPVLRLGKSEIDRYRAPPASR